MLSASTVWGERATRGRGPRNDARACTHTHGDGEHKTSNITNSIKRRYALRKASRLHQAGRMYSE
eukprot:6178377-Pleurochrysis_carterae.AAC.1